MTDFIRIHPENPQPRYIKRVAEALDQGAVIAYPTDSSYALGCHLNDKNALERVARLRDTPRSHNFTLVSRDLSHIADYAKIDNQQYRILKAATPGPFTFILPAKRKVPRRIMQERRKTIGLRIPDNQVALDILRMLDEPILSSTLILPQDELPLGDPEDIFAKLQHKVDIVVDGGHCGLEPTTVIDWQEGSPTITRQGKGIAQFL